MSYTPEQVKENFVKASKHILPAILVDSLANGHLVNARMHREKIEPSVEGFVAVITQLYKELDWIIPPAKLVADQTNEKPLRVENPIDAEKVFAERKATIEAREKLAASNAATEKLIEGAIVAYYPSNRMGKLQVPKQAEEQTRLRGYVKQQIARNANRKEILDIVTADIERLYKDEARVNERSQ